MHRYGITKDCREPVEDIALKHQAITSTSCLLLVMPEISSKEVRVNATVLCLMVLFGYAPSLSFELWDSNWESVSVVEAIETTVVIQSKLCTAHEIWVCQ